MSEKPAIECKPNGPYLVRGLEDLRDWRGNRIETKPVMALCRCGGSKNKLLSGITADAINPMCSQGHRIINKITDAKAQVLEETEQLFITLVYPYVYRSDALGVILIA